MTITIPTSHYHHLTILRGDMVAGGAKTPALLRYLPRLNHTRFAYIGSVYGLGAWAMAEATSQLGLECSLFIARSSYRPHWIEKAEQSGAIIHWCDPLPVATLHENITNARPDLHVIPLGFDTPEFISDMAAIMRDTLLLSFPTGKGTGITDPPEIWVPSLSGVLSRSACLAFPHTPIHAVSAAKHPGDIGRATLHTAPEKFHHPAKTPPPYPACPFSDGKLWQFAEKTAVSGAFIWNVGF